MRVRSLALMMLAVGCESTPPMPKETPAVDSHDSRTSLDWSGTYRGVTPCADCEGIETSITLFENGSFSRGRTYLGKRGSTIEDRGTFVWDDTGGKVTLEAKDGHAQTYQVGENVLYHLDREGNRVTGALAERYVLRKQGSP